MATAKAPNRIEGTEGKDVLTGTSGNDLIIGGAGADKLTGGAGADIFRFTDISDSYRTATKSFADLITDFNPSEDKVDIADLGFKGLGNGLNGTLAVRYNAETDRTYLKSFEADADGNRFEIGFKGNLLGSLNEGNVLFERLILGTDGNDRLTGTDANETFVGGLGRDVLTGNGGANVFRYDDLLDSYRNYSQADGNHGDRIKDFNVSADRIDVSALGFTGLGNGHDNTLDIVLNESGTRTYVKSRDLDADGNRFEIALHGDFIGQLSASNFVFASTSSTKLDASSAASVQTAELAPEVEVVGQAHHDAVA